MKIKKWVGILMIVVGVLLLPMITKAGKLKAPDVFDAGKWTYIGETSKIADKGAIQSMCVTRDYILCIENASNKTTAPDTIVAFYKNDYDVSGNPVEQYSYAFHINEMDYEHCNGSTYNEQEKKVIIASGPGVHEKNLGTVYMLDAETLKFEKQISVFDNGEAVIALDYVKGKNQYVLLTELKGYFKFILTDSEFRVLDTIVEGDRSEGNKFQDFCVSGDYIVGLPYFRGGRVEQRIQIYSLSKGEWINNYPLILEEDMSHMEPEGICEVSPGHFMVGSILNKPRRIGLYSLKVPVVYNIKTKIENGTISKGKKAVDYGGKFKVEYTPDEGYEIKEILVNDEPVDLNKHLKQYNFEDIDSDQTIRVICTKIPQYYVKGRSLGGTIDEEIQVYENKQVTVNFKPDKDYRLKSIFVDGQLVDHLPNATSYEFEKVSEDHEIYVEFEQIPTHMVTVSVVNGYTSEVEVTVLEGENYTANFKPKNNYVLHQLLVDGEEVSHEEDTSSYEVKMIYADHKIEAIYQWQYLGEIIALGSMVVVIGLVALGIIHLQRVKKRR